MSITESALNKQALTYFLAFLIIAGGIFSFFRLGKLEDPTFTVKSALVAIIYQGAGSVNIEEQLTDPLEAKIQELAEVKRIKSYSKDSMALIKVDLKDNVKPDKISEVWTRLRYKAGEAQAQMPSGAMVVVQDDIGDVYGFVVALSGQGYSDADLRQYAKELKRRLSVVTDVARVEVWGERQEAIYVEISEARLAQLGLAPDALLYLLKNQNASVDAGTSVFGGIRLRLDVVGDFQNVEDIQNFMISLPAGSSVALGDVAQVTRDYCDPARQLMRFNGQDALAVTIAAAKTGNIVNLGETLEAELLKAQESIPVGLNIDKVAWQSDLVKASINEFMGNLAASVIIVLVVLFLSMGLQMGIIIGTSVIFTILFTFLVMFFFGIDLHRVSLGALIVSLGMMGDNAIVVAEGMFVRFQSGMDRRKAALEASNTPSMPLLAATIIAFMSFFAVYFSEDLTGEYCGTLFLVMAISLLGSWFISLTITPLQCLAMLKPKQADANALASGKFYKAYRGLVEGVLRRRYLTLVIAIGALVFAFVLFGSLKQAFFPQATRPQAMVHVWTPEGSSVNITAAYSKAIANHINETYKDAGVTSAAEFIGQGAPRFYLPVEPELPSASFAEIVINFTEFKAIDGVLTDLRQWLDETYPEISAPVKKYPLGPSANWPFELRLSGPSDAASAQLRSLADQFLAAVQSSPLVQASQTDWRNRALEYEFAYDQKSGRQTGITRSDIALALKRNSDGIIVNAFREQDQTIPIVVRSPAHERSELWNMGALQTYSPLTKHMVPLEETAQQRFKWHDPIIARYNRLKTISIQAVPQLNYEVDEVVQPILPQIAAVELPEGYTWEWGGTKENSANAIKGLLPGLLPTAFIILLLLVMLFNSYRTACLIILVIPFAFIGVVLGLFIFQKPFGFLALVGALSLIGMMIKNSIVLLDQIHIEEAKGSSPYKAVVDSAISRLRPVVLAAATTILGVVPVVNDVFWGGLAVSIMIGLTVGTFLTMLLVPALYSIFFRIQNEEPAKSQTPAKKRLFAKSK